MEDVQDGKKISIQDGVTEDPELIEKLDIYGKSYCGLIYIMEQIKNLTVALSLTLSTDSEDFTSTISTVLGTSVV